MGVKTIKELERIRMKEDGCYVDVYYANAVDNLFFKMRRSLFIARAQMARTKQILLKNAIVQLEEKRGCKCDNLRLEFHVWGVVKRKCKKYANKLLNERVKEFYAGLGIVNRLTHGGSRHRENMPCRRSGQAQQAKPRQALRQVTKTNRTA